MSGIVILGIVAASSVWVYWDASTNKIGNISVYLASSHYSATDWALRTLLFWPIMFPTYIRIRSHLIHRAKDYPVTDDKRAVKIMSIMALASGYVALSLLHS